MLDQEDLKWIAATSTELNSVLQQVSRYADLARRHRGENNYIDLLGERVELASKTAQSLFDRVTSKILAGAVRKTAAARKSEAGFTIMPPPDATDDEPPRSIRTSRKGEQKRGSSAEAKELTASGDNGVPPGVRVKNPNGSREYLLLIEDEPDVADLASEMLAEEGYRVVIAHDGFEALKIYEKMGKQIGLVILDYFLPVIDGDAVFEELRSINPKVNVVLSSGFAEQTKIASMLAQGLRGFIPKPYSREKLLEQVRSTLDAARQPTR
ncbi:MAG TPA: response regulator [Chthoniobacterales bacterium]|jgi:CheY-like chemotaxis protein|nr:response regulator [Chthoniobacterales bacterium]